MVRIQFGETSMKLLKVLSSARLILILLLAGTVTACTDAPVGSKRRPFTMYFIPSVDTQTIALGADQVTDYLSKYVSNRVYGNSDSFFIKSAIPANYIAVVEAFGTKKADFAAFNTFSYILAKDIKKYDIEAILSVVRGDNERFYKGQIIARTDSGYKSIQDLKGKKFAYTDPASTAGYILPMTLFKNQGVELGQTVFALKHDSVVTMVYQKQVDAGATYYSPPKVEMVNGKRVEHLKDARERVLTQFPDVANQVSIIGFTEEIPNEPWVVRSSLVADPDLNKKIKEAITEGLLEFAATPNGKKILEELYSITGLARVDDSVYSNIRKTILQAEVDLESTLKGKK